MILYGTDRCVYHKAGVNCTNYENCGKCGWNPVVEEERKKKLQRYGKNALQKKSGNPNDEMYVKYILKNRDIYGGSMTLEMIQRQLGISDSKMTGCKARAQEIVHSLVYEVIQNVH